MKKYMASLVLLMVMFLGTGFVSFVQAGEIVYVEGGVQVRREGDKDWHKGSGGEQVGIGDNIKTARGSTADIALDEGKKNLIRVEEKTLVILNSTVPGEITKLDLSQGKLYANIEGALHGINYEVSTPSSIVGVRGTGFSVNSTDDGDEAAVYENNIYVKGFDQNKKLLGEITLTGVTKTYVGRFKSPGASEVLSQEEIDRWKKVKEELFDHAGLTDCIRDGFLDGGCPGTCGDDQLCSDRPGQCHVCEPAEEQVRCYDMQQQDGPCTPGACDSSTECKEFDYDGTKCHWCQVTTGLSGCPDLGKPGVCRGTCTSKQLCISRRGPCHMCMDVKKVEIVYVIIIIETPRGRYVLKNNIDFTGLTGFSPNSIMVLAKVDNKQLQELQRLAGSEEGGFTVGNVKDIAGMISERLGNKKSRYNDECFKEFSSKESSQSLPSLPSSLPSGGSSGDYGLDESKDINVDGPILACGQTQGEDSLAVFDGTGALVENIPKKELINDPQRIIDALEKAESAYQKFESLKSMTPQGFIKKPASTLVSELATARPSEQDFKSAIKERVVKEKRNKKKGIIEEEFSPNDPLYFKQKEEKKKLLGILGSSTNIGGSFGISNTGGFGSISVGAPDKKKGLELEDQWGIKYVGYTLRSDPNSAWNIVDGRDPNVVVAVIDSGLDMTHPDSPQYIWTNMAEIPENGIDDDSNGYIDDVHGWNFIDNNNDLRDFKGHGTFVSGIIAAKTDNGIGIAGINPGAIIMPLKVAPEEGEALSLNIYRAIRYAVDQGARVINLSLGGQGRSQLEQSAINYAHENNVFVAIASGNTGDYMGEVGPASAHRAFVVGASDYDNLRSTISSYGPNNAIMAPGEEIYSLRSIDSFSKRAFGEESLERLYFRQSGTSFSAPMVTATVSLMFVKNPDLTDVEIADILHSTAVDMDEEGWDDLTGAGMLNATGALRAVDQKNFLIVKLIEVRKNLDKKNNLESVDVFATVRGPFKEFVVEIGKGKFAKKFNAVAGPFASPADNQWITRIDQEYFRGSQDWVLRLKVVDKNGKDVYAKILLLTR
ncbi:MAG: S8 family serine peptidase [Candidatus Omnitrophica bacterium]|nr:S8 family serine peptidase [Candidatus Omnitrophota bacterium]